MANFALFRRHSPEHAPITLLDKPFCAAVGCLQVFETRTLLQWHAWAARHKPYRCQCGFEGSKENFDYHLARAKREALKNINHKSAFEKTHTCAAEGCHRVFPNGSKLKDHAKKTGHKAFQCVCSKGFSRLGSLTRHVDEYRESEAGKYRCPLKSEYRYKKSEPCAGTFKRLNHLEQHLRSKNRFGHNKSGQELELLLLPFRKRRPTARKSAVTAGIPTTIDAAHGGPSTTNTGNNSTTPDPPINKNAAAQKAFLAVTMGAIPLTQDDAYTMPTAAPTSGQAGFQASPSDFSPWPAAAEGVPSSISLSSLHPPAWSNNRSIHGYQESGYPGFPINGYSSSQSVYGDPPASFVDPRCLNGYVMPAPNSHVPNPMNNQEGFGMHYNASSMASGLRPLANSTGPLDAYPPMHPNPLQPTAFNHGQLGFIHPIANHMVSNVGTGEPARPQSAFAGQNLVDFSTAAPLQAQVFTGLMDDSLNDLSLTGDMNIGYAGMGFNNDGFNLAEDMNIGDAGMGFNNGADMDFGYAGF